MTAVNVDRPIGRHPRLLASHHQHRRRRLTAECHVWDACHLYTRDTAYVPQSHFPIFRFTSHLLRPQRKLVPPCRRPRSPARPPAVCSTALRLCTKSSISSASPQCATSSGQATTDQAPTKRQPPKHLPSSQTDRRTQPLSSPAPTMAHVATSSASPPVAPTSSPPNAAATAVAVTAPANPTRPRNRIQVSREKRPLYFFIGLAKKFLLSEEEVELSGLGLAVTTVVTVAEILKNSGHVTISSTSPHPPAARACAHTNAKPRTRCTEISTSLVDMHRDGRSVDPRHAGGMPKAKIQIWIRKSPDFDKLVAFVDHAKK